MITCKEAIGCIENVLNSDYHYDESLGYQLTSDDFEWLKKAKEALEKQMPKKPIKANYIVKVHGVDTLLDENEFTKCSSCKYKDVEVKGGQKYCHICGQALDWSDTK